MTQIAASPSTRRLALEKSVDIDALGRSLGTDMVTRTDVLRVASGGTTLDAGNPNTRYWDVDHNLFGTVTPQKRTRIEKLTAANLTAAQQEIPAVTHHDKADMGAVEDARKRLKVEAEKQDVKLTALAFHVKALAKALQLFPNFNSSLSADGETLFRKEYISIGVAVDTPIGLMVPVLRNVDQKGLLVIAHEISDLATRARLRKIRPDEMGGASMSISNLGGIGGTAFTPMINPPEVAILGITRTEIMPVWNGVEFLLRPMVPLDLTYDHRVINGAEAALFMRRFAELIGNPAQLVL